MLRYIDCKEDTEMSECLGTINDIEDNSLNILDYIIKKLNKNNQIMEYNNEITHFVSYVTDNKLKGHFDIFFNKKLVIKKKEFINIYKNIYKYNGDLDQIFSHISKNNKYINVIDLFNFLIYT